MKRTLLRTTVFLVALATPLWAIGAEGEVEQYVAGIRSVGDVKRLLHSHLNPGCATGSCVDNNAGEVCNLVAALDLRVGGGIATPVQPAQGSDLAITGGDLQLMRRIWRQCKPTTEGFWRHGVLLRVTYQGDEKEAADVSSALLAGVNQRRSGVASRAATDPKENKALTNCFLSEAERGAYNSLDGGQSALSILKACQSHVSKWVDSCKAGGEPRDSCAKKTLILGQFSLKLVGK